MGTQWDRTLDGAWQPTLKTLSKPEKSEIHKLHSIFNQLNLPEGQWVLTGSGVMALHGINPRPLGDVDLMLATRTWFQILHDLSWNIFTTDPDNPHNRCDPPYLYKEMEGIPVHIFFDWRTRGVADTDVNAMIRSAEIVRGWPCVSLKYILGIKRELNRPKDLVDIDVLERYLNENL